MLGVSNVNSNSNQWRMHRGRDLEGSNPSIAQLKNFPCHKL